MKMFYKTTIVIMLLCLSLGVGQAKTVTLQADTDCDVDSGSPDTAFPAGSDLQPQLIELGLVDEAVYTYVHFTAPPDWNPVGATDFSVRLTRSGTAQGNYIYWFIVEEDDDISDVDDLTWDTAPGTPEAATYSINGSTNYNTGESNFINSTSNASGVAGDTVDFNPTLWASHTYPNLVANETDGKITLFFQLRYASASASLFAADENVTYNGPQLNLTYDPAKVAVDQGVDYLTVTEGGASDSYSVYLTSAPASDVTVTMDYDEDQIVVTPDVLTFTSANYATPQVVSVSAVDDDYAERDARELISHTTASTDANFEDVYVGNVFVNVIDDDSFSASLTAVKDSTVKRSSPSTAFPTGDLATQKFGGDPGTSADMQVSYVQFQLPADHLYSAEATFKIIQTSTPNASVETKLYLFGIDDDQPQADADTFTWLTAPGLDLRAPLENGLNGYDPEAAVYLGDLDLVTTGAAGVELSTSAAESVAISNWLSTDTDKTATVMIVRQIQSPFIDSLASVENATYDAAKLDLLYGDVPYCGRPGQEYDLQDVDGDCIVNLIDLSVLSSEWME